MNLIFKKNSSIYLSFFIVVFGFVLISASFPSSIKAVSAGDWKPGRIIDDAVFFNKDAMSPAQIQEFLNAKVPVCDTNHQASFWSGGVYNAPPYTCLKDYNEGGKSSAQIIWEAGQTHGINPQTLIVMLQKESALVTDTWAAPWQYKSAMGYGCPDTADCDSKYFGFTNQVNNAAWQLRAYVNNPNGYNFKAGVTRNIQWSPNGACGSSAVYLENSATAALYNYTPYQPNQAALNNLYGAGDGCSAYGNRNFWRMFNDWFGSTSGPAFSAQLIYQSPYPTISAGQTVEVVMSYKNTGSVYWRDDRTAASFGQYPIRLATANNTNRISQFGASWPSGSRPATNFNKVYDIGSNGITIAADQTVVHPGQIAEFVFKFTPRSDTTAGTYRESFFPVREGTSAWYMGGLSWLDLTVRQTYFSPAFYRQSNYPTIRAGESTPNYFDIKNTGNTTWYDEISKPAGIAPLRLATFQPINRPSALSSSWPNSSRPNINFSKVFESDGVTISADQHIAQPNQIVRFDFDFNIPTSTQGGIYREYFTPILEGAPNWNIGQTMWLDVNVLPVSSTITFAGQSSYPTIQKGATANAFFMLKNNGAKTLYDSTSAPTVVSPLHLATTNPINRSSIFSEGWLNSSRPAVNFSQVYEADGTTLTTDQHRVLQGQIAKFDFTLKAPNNANPGIYREYFTPILEGAPNWNIGQTMWLDIQIN
jgi:hypothetical protein